MKMDFRKAIYSSDRTVFRLRDIGMLTGITDADRLKAAVSYYAGRGVIQSLRKGIYAKDDYSGEELACRVYVPSYISLETVLGRSGVIFQYTSAIMAVSYLSRTIRVYDHEIAYRKLKNSILIETRGIRQDRHVSVATPERAFLDRLYLSSEYYFDNLSPLDKSKIETLLPIYQCKALEQRVGRVFKNG